MDPETENEEGQELVEEAIPIKEEVAEQEPANPEQRYVPYHQSEETGIIDTEINAPIGNDMIVILTHILNKLDNIEKSTG